MPDQRNWLAYGLVVGSAIWITALLLWPRETVLFLLLLLLLIYLRGLNK